jgi:hypothetical protein
MGKYNFDAKLVDFWHTPMAALYLEFMWPICEDFIVWGVMSGDRPGPVGDLEDPFGVLQVGLPGTAPAQDTQDRLKTGRRRRLSLTNGGPYID